MLVDVSEVTTATTVLGTEVALPVLVAPTAFQRVAHPDGELAMARGAAAAGSVLCLSTPPRPRSRRWRPRRRMRRAGSSSTGRVTAASCGTSSSAAAAADYGAVMSPSTFQCSAAGSAISERGSRSRRTCPCPPSRPGRRRLRDAGPAQFLVDNSLTWRDLEWLRSVTSLPILVKGILTAEDARLAVEAGVEGIVVSNHGGRQLDGAPATLDVLPEVVEAVGGGRGPARQRHPPRDRRRQGARARRGRRARRPRDALGPRGRRRRRRRAGARAAARRDRARARAVRLQLARRGHARARRSGGSVR